MPVSRLGPGGVPASPQTFGPKAEAGLPSLGQLVEEFDVWQPGGYGAATVYVYKAGTTDLASLYLDETLTQRTTNPQILITKTDGLDEYSRFALPIYTPNSYTLDISTGETTGARRVPLYGLDGVDARFARSITKGGSVSRSMEDRFADEVRVLDHAALGPSAAKNSEAIVAALGVAASRGGGFVLLPHGTIPVLPFSIPIGVVLEGEGRDATILQMQTGGANITITGDDAGLARLSVDGVNLTAGSIGVFAKARSRVVLRDVEVKRFATGIQAQGGRDWRVNELIVSTCNKGFRGLGDDDFGSPVSGDEFSGLIWRGGEVRYCNEFGVELLVKDMPVRHNLLEGVDLHDNAGASVGLSIYGAAWTRLYECHFWGNSKHLATEDNADTSLPDRQVIGLTLSGGSMNGGAVTFDGLCQDVTISDMEIIGVEYQLNVPTNPILLRDCTETDTSVAGEATALRRWRTTDRGTVSGSTTDASAVTAWKMALQPNAVHVLRITATAEQVNGTGYAQWILSQGVRCGPATLGFDNQTDNFSLGKRIVGQTSGASGIVVAQTDSGTLGAVNLADVSGAFVDNELINESEDGGTGAAQVNGVLTYGSAALVGSAASHLAVGSNTNAPPSGWAVAAAVSGQEVRVDVTGAASASIIWTLQVEVL